ncbi:unnamed protein product [Camellia sinensis]
MKAGQLHPGDLKPALSKALNKILQTLNKKPVRDHFKNDPAAKELLKRVKVTELLDDVALNTVGGCLGSKLNFASLTCLKQYMFLLLLLLLLLLLSFGPYLEQDIDSFSVQSTF